jgi:hypothetical protein
MAAAKQKQHPTTKYAVSLVVEGTNLETVANQIKKAVGEVKVLGVEKVIVPAPGEWGTEWVKVNGYMTPVLVNTDGRIIQRFEEYGDDDQPIEGKYAYYTVRDIHGRQIRNVEGEWHVATLEEAKTLMDEPLTQAELMAEADILSILICTNSVGAGGNLPDADAERVKEAAETWLLGRNKELPEEKSEEEEGNRRAPEYIVTMRIKASTLPTVEKKAKEAFGEKLISVEKVGRGFSRAAELAEAEQHVNEAAEIVSELLSDMEERRDNTPENFQGGETYEMVESAVDSLEQLKDELEGISFDVEFPGFC